jgi:hypothetical protein
MPEVSEVSGKHLRRKKLHGISETNQSVMQDLSCRPTVSAFGKLQAVSDE